MKCFLGILNFLEEISSFSHSIVFIYFLSEQHTGTHIRLNYLLGPTGVRYYLELWPKGNPGREIAAAAGNLHPEPTKKRSQKVKRI